MSASPSPPSLTLIVPIFNEMSSIETVLTSLLEEVARARLPAEVIVVDDGSTDRTPEILETWGDRVTVLRHRVNRGYGASLKTGLAAARGDWVGILDCDQTYPLDRLADLWRVCREGADMVIGARVGPGAKIPWIRRPAKWAIRRLAAYLSGYEIPDLNSGFRIFRRSLAQKYHRLLPDTFSFTTTLSLALLTGGYRVEYLPIEYHARRGKSKIRPIRDTYNFVMLILRTTLYFDPLRVFLPLGMLFIVSGLALLVYRAVAGHGFGVTSVLLFVTGVQLIALGLLADLINRRGTVETLTPAPPPGPHRPPSDGDG